MKDGKTLTLNLHERLGIKNKDVEAAAGLPALPF
jgi:hypothetical protein